jgi:hypothetical protein
MSSVGSLGPRVVVDECVWELAAKSNFKAQALLALLFTDKAKLVIDEGCEYYKRLLKKLNSIRHSCAGAIAHLLNIIFRSRDLLDYKEPVNVEDAPKEDRLIAGLAVMADALITEDEELKEWFQHKRLRTKVLKVDEALSILRGKQW